MRYDYRNQLIALTETSESRYGYDVFGRRIRRLPEGDLGRETIYYYCDSEVCEERTPADNGIATYVLGNLVDQVIERSSNQTPQLFYHADEHGNVVALTDGLGNAIERYEYGDYGERSVLNASGDPISNSTVDNVCGFGGLRHDAESGWYYVRHRYLDCGAGRFVTRDPLGVWGDARSLGCSLSYAAVNPGTYRDNYGLQAVAACEQGLKFIARKTVPRLLPGVGWVLLAVDVYLVTEFAYEQTNCFGTCVKTKEYEKEIEVGQEEQPCPPCPPGDTRIDVVPPSKPHYPCKGTHIHRYINTGQGPPPGCKCSYRDEVECL